MILCSTKFYVKYTLKHNKFYYLCQECKNNWHGDNCDLYCDPYLKNNQSDKVQGGFGCYGHGTCAQSGENMECTCNLDTTRRISVGGKVNDYTSYYDPNLNCGECEEIYFPKQHVFDAHGAPPGYTVPCENSCEASTCDHHGECNHNFGAPGKKLMDLESSYFDTLNSLFLLACLTMSIAPDTHHTKGYPLFHSYSVQPILKQRPCCLQLS